MPKCKYIGKYERHQEIGRGTYGSVYEGWDPEEEIKVAIKKIAVNGKREADILGACQDAKHILQLKDCVQKGEKLYMIMEFMESDVEKVLSKRGRSGRTEGPERLAIAEVKAYLIFLLKGVDELHQRDILHRDLKPNNILVTGRERSTFLAKIGDMGMATRMKTEHTSRSIEVVTRTYRAPELFFGDDQYGKAVDMWSVGCIFAEMVLGKPLFEGVSDIDHLSKVFAVLGSPTENGWKEASNLPCYLQFKDTQPAPLMSRLEYRPSDLGIDLLQQLLQLDPKKRITAIDALHHSFFKEEPLAAKGEQLIQTIPAPESPKKRLIHNVEPVMQVRKIKARRLI
uniref:Cyclin-dependent kinase 2 homolog n=1 Tax=Albugo laibachii Nc14 TaxID=890382 RepID=F0WEL3_9STRA|nr:cyclindependent kinase putative [Albugo laibachii Nc14]CCA23077.1 cyclindependent kinase putative [Albugo laibachii Nc14]|eukprot:CCA23077.1 cyclindependent kinase putative [Albugo laibachii Nc14]